MNIKNKMNEDKNELNTKEKAYRKKLILSFPAPVAFIARIFLLISIIISLIGCFGPYGKYEIFNENIRPDGVFLTTIYHDDIFSVEKYGLILFFIMVFILIMSIILYTKKSNKLIKLWYFNIFLLLAINYFMVLLIKYNQISFDAGANLTFIGLASAFIINLFIIPKKHLET